MRLNNIFTRTNTKYFSNKKTDICLKTLSFHREAILYSTIFKQKN